MYQAQLKGRYRHFLELHNAIDVGHGVQVGLFIYIEEQDCF